MAVRSDMEPNGRFGHAFAQALEKHGTDLRELAAKLDGSYEHMRKVYKGLAYPSKYLLKEICKALKLDLAEMEQLVTKDKLERQFGSSLHTALGSDPRMAEFEELVPHLTNEQVK